MRIYCMPNSKTSGSAAVYALLRYAFSIGYGSCFPQIKKTPNGKPYFPERPDVHFSLSHTKTHVLCALSSDPVGADIESPRHISQRAIRFFCSSDELSIFDPLDLWVLKESYIKLFGETLPTIRKIHFSRKDDMIIVPDRSVVSKLYRVADCRAAVTGFDKNLPKSIELINSSAIYIYSSDKTL